MNLNLKPWMTLIPAGVPYGQPYLQLIQADLIDAGDDCNNAGTNAYVRVEGFNGEYLASVKVFMEYPDGKPFQTTRPKGELDYCGELWGTAFIIPGSHGHDGGGSFNPAIPGAHGPYTFYPEGPADKLAGIGIELNQHQQHKFVWRKTLMGNADPSVPGQTLAQAAQAAANARPWMPINNTAALWKYAHDPAHYYEDAQTDEYHFQFNGVDYIGQVFNRAILYAPVLNVNQVLVIPK